MKDIDFDELDRAVGSVLGTVEAPKPATQTAATPVVSEPVSTLTPQPSQPVSQDASTTSSATNQTPKIGPVAPARRRGQFLDMVHPSADMRHKSTLPVGVRKTLAPLTSAAAAQPTIETPLASKPADSSVMSSTVVPEEKTNSLPVTVAAMPDTSADTISHEETEVSSQKDTTSTGWPDPLDLAEKLEATPDNSNDEIKSHDSFDMDADAGTETSNENFEAAQTPFVPDAKVDKRPLGAFADADNAETADISGPAESNAVVPELASDVNSIEAAGIVENAHEVADEGHVDSPAEHVEPTPAPAATPQATAQPASSPLSQSISQQYKTAAPETDTAVRPLFDTEEYHQPLLPDTTKKSHKGLVVTILLIVLLALGGVLGYFAYTMGI